MPRYWFMTFWIFSFTVLENLLIWASNEFLNLLDALKNDPGFTCIRYFSVYYKGLNRGIAVVLSAVLHVLSSL